MTLTAERAREIMRRFAEQRILVVGDLMLDRYIFGRVERLSPEAPVPVVEVTAERAVLGGASNVAENIRALGGQAEVAGFLGPDTAGEQLRGLLGRRGIGGSAVLTVPEAATVVKMRVVAERQQVVRVDWEGPKVYPEGARRELARRVAEQLPRATGVIIEDYGKGVIQQDVVDVILEEARRARMPCGLDPKENHELRVDGISVATPNRKEAYTIAGARESPPEADPMKDMRLREVGAHLMAKWKPEMLAITLGPQGMMLFEPGGAVRHIPTRAREVYDVSGAGDTVIATCVLALAAGASHVEAVELANYAAGVVVGKLGTASCTPEELLDALTRP